MSELLVRLVTLKGIEKRPKLKYANSQSSKNRQILIPQKLSGLQYTYALI